MEKYRKIVLALLTGTTILSACHKEVNTRTHQPDPPAYLVGRWKMDRINYSVFTLAGIHLKDTVAYNNNNNFGDTPGEYEVFAASGNGLHILQQYISGNDGPALKRDTDFAFTYIITKDSLKLADPKLGYELFDSALLQLRNADMHQQYTYSNAYLDWFNISGPDPNAQYKVIADSYWIKQP